MSLEHQPPEHPHPALAGLVGPLPSRPGALAVRQPSREELPLQLAAVDSAYGAPFRPGEAGQQARLDAMMPMHNRRVVVEQLPDGGERILGGAVRFDTELSLPGGGRVPVGALSGVGIDPGAQHRGAFRELMREHLAECRSRGDAASVLMASITALYPRFGYGCVSQTADWQIDVPAARLRPDAPTSGSVHVEHARGAALHAALDDVWRAAGAARAGALTRSAAWWATVMSPEATWLGGGKLLVALHTVDGQPDGYVLFTVDADAGRQGLSEAEITIKELVAVETAAELDLWRFLTEFPWARRISWHYAPIDPAPLFWLADPRQLRRMAHFDFLWLRPLDMAALVGGRSFGQDGLVALAVSDPGDPALAGRFDLRVADGVGDWSPGRGAAQLAVPVGELASLWLGGASARELLAMRRVTGDAAAAAALDAMLGTGLAPRSIARF